MWLAYASPESGRFEVYVQSTAGNGQRFQVSPAGGDEPIWRADGKEIVYVAPDTTLMAVPITGSGPQLIAGQPKPLFRLNLARDPTYFPTYAATPSADRFLVSRFADPSPLPVSVLINWATP